METEVGENDVLLQPKREMGVRGCLSTKGLCAEGNIVRERTLEKNRGKTGVFLHALVEPGYRNTLHRDRT